ncbi:Aste57867_13718 [Aphanomyces stellatus]|uniref:Aste57867_13718 protein n=1 Tax=Aphanomyces stellatus TaxID=120398 RepID=A0A485KZE0_9STRA|nr:hypothetical protein As57867_013668 [Aphanomyces stellatus]VFT90551.1 Aste57867_13718 [Aphanomyces stellatus]
MWAMLLAMYGHTAFIAPHTTFNTPYLVIGGTYLVGYMYRIFTAPYENSMKSLPRSITEDWCVRLFGKVPETEMRVWRNDAKFKLSTLGFGSVLLTAAATYVLGDLLQWTPVAFAVMLAGTSVVTVVDEVRDVVGLMMQDEKKRQKRE